MKKYDKRKENLKMVNQLLGMHGNRSLSKNSNLYKKIMGDQPKKKKTINEATEKQLSGRQKFTVAVKAVALCKPLTDITYEWASHKVKTGVYGSLFKQIYHNFIRGSYPDFMVFYPQLKLSPSYEFNISQPTYEVSANGLINVAWEDPISTEYNYNDASVVFAFVINVTKQTSRLYQPFPYPADRKLRLRQTDYSIGDELHCWVQLKWYGVRKVSACGYATEVKSIDPLNP